MVMELPESAAHVTTDPKRVYYLGAGCNPCLAPGAPLIFLTRPCVRPCPILRPAHNMLDGLRQGLVRIQSTNHHARRARFNRRPVVPGSKAIMAHPETHVTRESKAWPVIRVASGNFLEMYDFMIFGYYAAAIGQTFFPSGSEFASLMKALMTFGAGYLMRPLGAIVLGSYMDQHGRRKGLLLTLGLMAVGTLSIACTPGYRTIGWIAPVLVLFGRLLQGLSARVELGGVSVYLSEIATPGRKGFFVSWQSASQQVAVVLAAVVGIALTYNLSADRL